MAHTYEDLGDPGKEASRFFWPDLMRFIGSFMVVMLHASARMVYRFNPEAPARWWSGNIYDSLVRAAVPLFVMLSGALLLAKQEKYISFFFKRFRKLLVPLLFWGVLYLIWDRTNGNFHTFEAGLSKLLSGQVYFHLWFLYMIIGLYFTVPIFRAFIAGALQSDLTYFLILWLALRFLLPKLIKWYGGHIHLQVPLSLEYTGYFIGGYYLSKVKLSKMTFWGGLIMYLIAAGATAYLTYDISWPKQQLDETYYDYLSLNVVAMAVGCYLCIRYIGRHWQPGKVLNWIIKAGASASMGIYLIHIIILETLERGYLGFELSGTMWHPVYRIPLTAIVVFILSGAISYLLGKIPVLKWLVP